MLRTGLSHSCSLSHSLCCVPDHCLGSWPLTYTLALANGMILPTLHFAQGHLTMICKPVGWHLGEETYCYHLVGRNQVQC